LNKTIALRFKNVKSQTNFAQPCQPCDENGITGPKQTSKKTKKEVNFGKTLSMKKSS
jgi:hypothetical protein